MIPKNLIAASLLALTSIVGQAQTPDLTSDVPAQSFLGEQFCFETNLSNTGSPGFGPYLRVELSGDLSLDSATTFGTASDITNVGVFTAPDNQLVDPIIDQTVTGTEGNSLYTISYPVGSVVDGGPDLPIEICLTIDPGATVGDSLPVDITPIYELGDTATGDNGPIPGATVNQDVTPTVLTFSKTPGAPESERPPATTWLYTYTLTADIANTATVNPLVISDQLPDDFQFTGSVNINGGSGCSVTTQPSTVTPGGDLVVTCSGNTVGTSAASDVQVTYSGYITDTLDETVCTTEDEVNNASADGTYVPSSGPSQVLPIVDDTTTVTAKHVAVQKAVSPGQAAPGVALDYTLNFQVTDFGDADSLVVTDIIPDGIDFVAHDSLTVNGSTVAITPSVTVNGDSTKTVVYDIAAVAGTIPAGSSISLAYDAQLRQDYQNTGEPVLSSDSLSNTVTAEYGLAQGASGCSDGSGATVDIIPVALSKEIVNEQQFYVPGESVVFRLTLDIPAGDTSQILFEDFLPLPVIDVNDISTNFGVDIVHGPGDTLGLTPDNISISAAQNALFIDWPDVTSTTAETIEVDVSAPINDIPFADGLSLTNILLGSTENTPGQTAIATGPVNFSVGAPDMVLTKGVLSTNGNGTINPAPGDLPVDGDISDVDAGDTISYRLTAENIGSAQAFGVTLTDPGVAQLTGCTIGSVTDGTGSPLSFTGTLAGGIVLDNPLAANDGNPSRGGAPYGADTALVTYDCQVVADLPPDSTFTNTVELVWESQPGANDFPAETDSSVATSTDVGQTKYFISSSESTTSDLATPPRATIGEIVRYRMALRIPEGEITDLVLRDNLPSGLTLLDNGTATAAFVSNGGGLTSSTLGIPNVNGNAGDPSSVPSSSITFAIPGGAISPASFGNGTDPLFAFGDVTNADSDTDDEFLLVEFDAVVNNTSAGSNDTGDNRDNNFTTLGNGSVLNGNSNNVRIRIAEPQLTTTKTATPTSGDAGDVINFDISVSAASGGNRSSAFDARITDTLPGGLSGLTINSITPSGGCSGITDNTAGNSLDISVSEMSPGCLLQIDFDATLTTGVAPGTTITNVAGATWTSLPGANGTGSATPGAPGSATGERTGAGGVNDYSNTGQANVTVESVAVSKAVTATSETETGSAEFRPGIPDLVIGESATFDMTVTIPEGTTPQVIVTDTVPYLNGVMRIDSASVVSVGANLSPANPSPVPTIADNQLADGVDDTASFDFGQVVNTADNTVNADDRIVVRVVATLIDVPANANDDDLTNNVLVQFGSGLNASASADVDVVEPILSVVKSGDITQGDAGDTVTYTVTLAHTGASAADAQDLIFDDPLPADLNLNLASIQVTSGPNFDANNSSGNTMSLGWTDLLQSETIVLEYQATLEPSVQPNETLTNTADLTWDSIAGADADQRTNNANDSHSILVTEPGLVKVVTATSEPSTGNGEFGPPEDLTIGEEVTYQITIIFPEGTSDSVVVSDQLPTGSSTFSVVSSRVVSVGANLSGPSLPTVGQAGAPSDTNTDTYDDRVGWNLGNIQNLADGTANADDEITFEVVALVPDVPANQSGDTAQVNTATFDSATSTVSGTVAVDLVAPTVNLAKQIVTPPDGFVDAGDAVTVRLDIDHTSVSTADAFNLAVDDTLPSGMSWSGDGTVAGNCPGLATDSTGEPVIRFDIPVLDQATGNCFITYEVTVDNTVQPGQTLQNSAVLDYDSQPTFVAGETRRRMGADTAQVTVLAPTLVKVDIDSGLADTGMAEGDPTLRDLTIGETVTYQLTVVFPEGMTQDAIVIDTLPANASAGFLEAIGASVTGVGGNLSTTSPGTPVLSDDVGADGIDETVTFDFGDVTNAPDGVDDAQDRIQIEIVARVVDVADNADGDVLVNNAQFTFNGGSLSDDADIELVEPQTNLTKSMGPVTNGTVRINLTIENTGTAPAYDLSVEDVFDEADWDLTGFSAVSTPAGFVLNLQPATPGPGQQTLVFATDPGAVSPGGTVPPGSSVSAVFDVPLAVLPPNPNPLPNTADQVAGDTLPGNDPAERDLPTDSDTDQIGVPDLALAKTAALQNDADGSGDVSPGDTLRYTLTLDNNGAAAATGIVIDDSPDANSALVVGSVITSSGTVNIGNTAGDATIQVAIPSLAASDTAIIEYDTVIDSPLPAGVTEVVNQATFDSDELPPGVSDDPGPPDSDDPTVVPVNAAPDLSIVKTDSVGSAAPGDTVVYSLDYANNGNQDATGVVITETVPADTTFNAGVSTAGWSCGSTAPGSTCTFNVGNLGAGDTGSVSFAVDVDAPLDSGVTQVLNATSIADDGSNGPDPTPDNNSDVDTTPINGAAPDLVLNKDDGGGTTVPGGSVAWTLDYENVGNQQATGVSITDTVPANSSFNAGASTAGWVCVPDNSAGSTCTFKVGTLSGNGGSGSVTFAVDLDNPLAAGVTQLVNSAAVADDGNNGADPTPGNNSDGDNTPINGAVPDLVLTKDDGGASTTPGGTVVWNLNVQNVGNQGATGVVLTDTVPANSSFNPGASSPGWSCVPDASAGSSCSLAIGTLAGGGGSASAAFAVTVDNPLAAGVSELLNTASAADDGSNGADPTPGNNSDGDNTPITGAVPDLVLSKDDGGATTTPGGTVAWTLSFENVGNQDATGVVLTDFVPANATFDAGASSPGWSCIPDASPGSACSLAIGALAGGAARSGTFAVIVDDPIASGVTELFNGATVADDGSNGPDPTPDNNSDDDTTPVDAQFDLSIAKDDGGATAIAGGTIVYALDYLNSGDQNATGVEITETVPANTVFDAGASTPGWVCTPDANAGSSCVFTLGTVAGGDTGSVDFAVTVDDPLPGGVDEIANAAGIGDDGSNGPDPTPDDNSDGDTTPVDAVPDLRVVKSDGGVTAEPGDTVVWTLDYENVGDQDATGVEILETVPANTSFYAGASTAGWNCLPDASAGSTCTLTIDELNVGDSGQAEFAVIVDDPIPETVFELPNTVVIGDDGSNGVDANPDDNDSSVITEVEVIPELSITKVLTDAPDPLEPGSELEYTITATNVGNLSLRDVVVSDSLITPTGGSAPCENLAPGAICTLIGTYVLTQADIDDGEVLNSAKADSQQTDSVTVDLVTPVPRSPGLELVKNAELGDENGNGVGDPGEVIDYTIIATNTGNTSLTGVTVSDDLLGPLVCSPEVPVGRMAPGDRIACAGSLEIAGNDLGRGRVINRASVVGTAPDGQSLEDEDETVTELSQPIAVPTTSPLLRWLLILSVMMLAFPVLSRYRGRAGNTWW